jgi:UDP-N-acetylglucosamine:LPS N-acetylglucosamine transferase
MADRSGPGGDRVEIVSGSFGAGHDDAAQAIAGQLQDRGFQTRVSDIVDLIPGRVGRLVRDTYLRQVQLLPSSYRWMAGYAHQRGSVNARVVRWLECTHPALLDLAATQPTAMISTHPLASQALGELRRQRRLPVPVTTYLTDMSVHRLLVHPSVDLHLAVHQVPAHQAQQLGAATTRIVQPPVPAAFSSTRWSSRARIDYRRSLGLPLDQRLVLVTGGSRGIGNLEDSANDITATGLATPVVLCGRNERLRRRIELRSGAFALGWVTDMPTVLGAVDAVVQNSGGFTSLQTLAAGRPILTYRCLPGHGEANAAALEQAGMVPWIKKRGDLHDGLAAALTHLSAEPEPTSKAFAPTVAEALVAGSLSRSG